MKTFVILVFAGILFVSNLFADVKSKIYRLSEDLVKEYQKKVSEPIIFKKRLAVFNFKDSSPYTKKYKVGSLVRSLITTRMSESLIFILIEREDINKVIKEMELGLTGIIDEETAPKTGKLLGAQLLLNGTVLEIGKEINIEAKLIDAETGEILVAKNTSLPRSEVIIEAKSYLESMFQSKYGISVSFSGAPLFSSEEHEQMPTLSGADVGYRISKNIKVGLGYFRISANEYIREKFTFKNREIRRNYNFKGSGVKFFIEGIISPLRWLNTGLRAEYVPPMANKLTQDLTDFPVYIPESENSNKLEHKRILVDGWVTEEGAPQFLNTMALVDFLISRRISFNLKFGYCLQFKDYTPFIFESGGRRQWTDKSFDGLDPIDINGTFSELQNFNFSKRGENGERIKLNFSGFKFSVGLSIHF